MQIGRTKNANGKNAKKKAKKAKKKKKKATYKGKRESETKKGRSKRFNIFLRRLRSKTFFPRYKIQEPSPRKSQKMQKNATYETSEKMQKKCNHTIENAKWPKMQKKKMHLHI